MKDLEYFAYLLLSQVEIDLSRSELNLTWMFFLIFFSLPRKKPTDEFLRHAVEARLRMLIPYIEKWPQV